MQANKVSFIQDTVISSDLKAMVFECDELLSSAVKKRTALRRLETSVGGTKAWWSSIHLLFRFIVFPVSCRLYFHHDDDHSHDQI